MDLWLVRIRSSEFFHRNVGSQQGRCIFNVILKILSFDLDFFLVFLIFKVVSLAVFIHHFVFLFFLFGHSELLIGIEDLFQHLLLLGL
jgi:hypothetical protein